MIRLLGCVLVAGGGAWLGIQASARLRDRVTAVSALIHALGLLRREICGRGRGLPQALEETACQSAPPVRTFFERCVQACMALDERPFQESWRQLVHELLELSPETLSQLEQLGEVLGRYEEEIQGRALDQAEECLSGELARAKGEWERMGRVYRILGLAGGGFLVILLL